MWTKRYGSRSVKRGWEENSVPRMWDRKEAAIVGLENSSMWTEVPKGTVKGEDKQRDIKRTFKMLREVWLNIGVEKINMYEGVTVKALLDSSATGMFMNRKMVAKYRFRLQKLERLVMVRNIDGINNSRGLSHTKWK